MTNRTLADRYADQDVVIKKAEDIKKGLKNEIVALGVELIEGDEVNVKVSLSQRSTMDFDLLFKNYGITEAQFKLFSACKKEGETFEVLKVVVKND